MTHGKKKRSKKRSESSAAGGYDFGFDPNKMMDMVMGMGILAVGTTTTVAMMDAINPD